MIDFIVHSAYYFPICIIACICIFCIGSVILFPFIPIICVYLIYILSCNPLQYELDFYYKTFNKSLIQLSSTTNIHRFVKSEKNVDTFLKSPVSTKPALYISHPHGLFNTTRAIYTAHEKSQLHDTFKKMRPAVHPNLFRIPIFREILMSYGAIPSSHNYVSHTLRTGQSVSLSIAGMREIKYCNNQYKDDYAYIGKRKGFLKIAKKCDVPIIPMYHWNEQHYLSGTPGILYPLMLIFNKITNYYTYMTLGDFQSIKKWFLMYMKSDNDSVRNDEFISTTYFGEPFYVEKNANIDEERHRYIYEFKKLYERVKNEENSDKNLTII
jgi:1-acyl-sn-glycerol-3-phosphate acyltransferase